MTYAFLIVVTVAITLKLMFLSFSLYFTLKDTKGRETQMPSLTKSKGKSLLISWKEIPRFFFPRLYCPEANTTKPFK